MEIYYKGDVKKFPDSNLAEDGFKSTAPVNNFSK